MRVRLEPPGPRREREFLGAVRRSRSLHRPWVAPPSTAASYRAYLRRLRGPGHDGYFVVLRSSGVLVGVINLSEIVRGPFRSAYLGYYAFVPHQGRGRSSGSSWPSWTIRARRSTAPAIPSGMKECRK